MNGLYDVNIIYTIQYDGGYHEPNSATSYALGVFPLTADVYAQDRRRNKRQPLSFN